MVPFILASFICYSLIFYTLKAKGMKKLGNTVTLNAFFYSLLCTLNFILWRFLKPLLHPKPIIYFWTNLPWIFWNGTYAITCILFNRLIRNNILKLLQCQRPNE
ncbi:hypothetical protein DICVIV_11763 [Dictyocaulus viviparus]|uniref:Serpentine receptor class gamma n=1 Tax=Dictyocaulus viviparus TaxID=29172 RepID=A0A0D8XCD9_DICVI|nr:hypothetical protein DICVIV_11763 [Dictyocaulus viviparus]